MSLDELRAVVERNKGRRPNALGFTFVARTSRGLGVRPQVLAENTDGTKVYGLTVAQTRRLLAKAEQR